MSSDFSEKLIAELKKSGAEAQLLAFALGNISLLESLTADTLTTIVDLLKAGDDGGAQLLLDAQMSPDQIIARENMNAEELAADTAKREKFLADLQQFGWAILPVIIKIGAGVASGGLAL